MDCAAILRLLSAHYGDFQPQPKVLGSGKGFLSKSIYVASYDGYENYVYFVDDPRLP